MGLLPSQPVSGMVSSVSCRCATEGALMLVNLLRSFKQRSGRSKVSIRLEENYPDIIEPEFRAALELCRPASMTSIERLYAVYIATRYAVESGVPGDLVECGVWKGGSVMMMASTLLGMGVSDRVIH